MGFNSILVPLDGSPLAEQAVSFAIKLATPAAHIHLLSAVDDNVFSEIAVVESAADVKMIDPAKQANPPEPADEATEVFARRKYLDQIANTLRAQGFNVTVELAPGYAPTVISAVLHKKDFDVVVMSTHGRTGLSKILVGSVAEEVLRNSPCPVLIVPAEATAQA